MLDARVRHRLGPVLDRVAAPLHARGRHRDGHADHEPPIHDEVGHEVDEPAQIRFADPPRQRAVEPVQRPVRKP